jgi:hypothetical protein
MTLFDLAATWDQARRHFSLFRWADLPHQEALKFQRAFTQPCAMERVKLLGGHFPASL